MISIADGPSESVSGEKDDVTILVIKDAYYYNESMVLIETGQNHEGL